MSRRFSGTTARKYDEHPEYSRRALLAKDRELGRVARRAHAAEDTVRLIAAVIGDEGRRDRAWTLVPILGDRELVDVADEFARRVEPLLADAPLRADGGRFAVRRRVEQRVSGLVELFGYRPLRAGRRRACGRDPRRAGRAARRARTRTVADGSGVAVVSDRRLWLEELCPSCRARAGLRCQITRYGAKPSRVLHGARGWRNRSCPTCKAQPGELCRTPTGRQAGQPHTARLNYGRRELFADEDVWQELERWGATVALVRFSGGGGSPGSIAAVTLEDAGKRELARWGHGEGELAEALAAPIWVATRCFAATPGSPAW